MAKTHRPLRYSLPVLVALAVLGAALASCKLPTPVVQPATITDCISGFSGAYTSGNYGNLYQYFSSSSSTNSTMRDPTTWDSTQFWSNYHPQALTNISVTSPTATASFVNDNFPASTNTIITFQMDQVSGYWYIKSLVISNSSDSNIETLS